MLNLPLNMIPYESIKMQQMKQVSEKKILYS